MGRLLGCAVSALLLLIGAAPAAHAASAWSDLHARGPARALKLDRKAMERELARAPHERTGATPAVISLPAPNGRLKRYAVQRTSIMEPAFAAAHPEIRTYSGRGIDEPRSTARLDPTSLGLHASVRGPTGLWYINPRRGSVTKYRSFYRRD